MYKLIRELRLLLVEIPTARFFTIAFLLLVFSAVFVITRK